MTSTRHSVINALMGKLLLASDSRKTRSDLLSVSVETEKQEIERRLAHPGLDCDGEHARPALRRFEEIRTKLAALYLYQTWSEERARLEQASQHHK